MKKEPIQVTPSWGNDKWSDPDSGTPVAAATPCSPSLDSLKGLKGIEYRKAWNKLHREKCRNANKAWRLRNPDKVGKVPQWLRDEYRASGKREKYKVVYYGGWDKASMRCEPWGVVEDCMVMDRKMCDKDLSAQLGRSVRAIQIRRCRLTKQNLEENESSDGAAGIGPNSP